MRVVRQTETQQSYKRSECFQKRILGVNDLAKIERVIGRVAGPNGRAF
jgi:hypothetical protein